MLRSILPTVLDTRCNNIYKEERSVAAAVADDVIGTQAVGVWDFMMPPLFFINFFKHKRKKEAFILNLLFTKKLALDAMREMVAGDLGREVALEHVAEATHKILSADSKGVYSEKVRQRQLKEIDLLTSHYHKLVMSGGRIYADMLKSAYRERRDYLEFLARLGRVEKEVNAAALQIAGKNEAARGFVVRMEKSLEEIRKMDADKYYPVQDVEQQ